jgi:hypothetical protein
MKPGAKPDITLSKLATSHPKGNAFVDGNPRSAFQRDGKPQKYVALFRGSRMLPLRGHLVDGSPKPGSDASSATCTLACLVAGREAERSRIRSTGSGENDGL